MKQPSPVILPPGKCATGTRRCPFLYEGAQSVCELYGAWSPPKFQKPGKNYRHPDCRLVSPPGAEIRWLLGTCPECHGMTTVPDGGPDGERDDCTACEGKGHLDPTRLLERIRKLEERLADAQVEADRTILCDEVPS